MMDYAVVLEIEREYSARTIQLELNYRCVWMLVVETKKYQTVAWYNNLRDAPDPSVCYTVFKGRGDERRALLHEYRFAELLCKMKAMSVENCQQLRKYVESDFDGNFIYRPIPEFFQHLYRYECLELEGKGSQSAI
ncbi:hypothetical protein Btru_059323 [Bulinus truncatus]|nr:hypothetical protein Btru_059323 [Bulinus truncatus]